MLLYFALQLSEISHPQVSTLPHASLTLYLYLTHFLIICTYFLSPNMLKTGDHTVFLLLTLYFCIISKGRKHSHKTMLRPEVLSKYLSKMLSIPYQHALNTNQQEYLLKRLKDLLKVTKRQKSGLQPIFCTSDSQIYGCLIRIIYIIILQIKNEIILLKYSKSLNFKQKKY